MGLSMKILEIDGAKHLWNIDSCRGEAAEKDTSTEPLGFMSMNLAAGSYH